MFDLLTPGKKISLLASAAVAFMMLTAFIASLTEDPANLDWASWLGYYSVLGYAVILVAGGLDFNTNKADIARVATAVFALGGVIGLVSGVMIFTMVMFILSGLAAIAACVLDYMANQKLNIVYALVALAFFLLMLFWIINVAASVKFGDQRVLRNVTVALMSYDFPTAVLAIAAGYNCYKILMEE